MTSSRTPVARAPGRSRVPGRVVAWMLGALLLAAVVAAGWVGVRGMLAFGHLQDAQRAATTLSADLGDPDAAAPTIRSVADHAAAAHGLTSDPVWRLAERLPWIGPQLAAVGTVATAADDLSANALQPLAEVASTFSLDSLSPTDGAIDVSLIAGLEGAADQAATGVARARDAVDAIDSDRLLPVVRGPIAEVQELLHEVSGGADALARASALMPAMLGADGPRSYLVLFQNNAEWRSLGGIVGATAVISTEGGRMSLTDQSSSADFPRYDDGAIPLSDDVLGIYDTLPGRYIQNATQVADFSVAAQIAREMWGRQRGVAVDGVISLDPVALSYLLAATGPVQLPTGDVLTSENAVSLLLNEVYLRYEQPADQDLFFEAAAATVFDALSSGVADPVALVEGLARAGDENRLLLWSADSAEQAVLDGTTLQGSLPVTDDERTTFGVYLNDGTGAKMDYYLTADASAGWCTEPDGGSGAALSFRLGNAAPADAASLPPYITGDGVFGIPPGTTRTVAWIYLPAGAELMSASATKGGQVAPAGTDGGHQVLTWSVELAPGEEAAVSLWVRTPETPEIGVRLTPTVYTPETLAFASSCENAG